jgi:hypothetical protein
MKNTYIYIKESPFGLKYLGKTINDPYEYKGSGKIWKLHLKKHNIKPNEIKTTILCETTDIDELKELGLYYSNLYGVVNSKDWANLKPEEGDGGDVSMFRKYTTHSDTTKNKIKNTLLGRINGPMKYETKEKIRKANLGNTHSEETKQKISKSKSGIKQTGESNQKRRNALIGKKRPDIVAKKISEAKKGKKFSEEHKQSLKGKRTPYGNQIKIKCIHCDKEGGVGAMNRWHGDKCKQIITIL